MLMILSVVDKCFIRITPNEYIKQETSSCNFGQIFKLLSQKHPDLNPTKFCQPEAHADGGGDQKHARLRTEITISFRCL